eukprot:m.254976 g.254976  ORF g.254976 m.254976 type:complete len:682 (+) comp19239_c0_seq1:285-2330(+)
MALLPLLLLLGAAGSAQSAKLVCYYGEWAQGASGTYAVPTSKLNVPCTHVVFSFATFGSSFNIINGDSTGQNYAPFMSASRTFGFKTILAFGGGLFSYGSAGATLIANMLASSSTRAKFISSAISHARQYGFGGIDIDFENTASSLSTKMTNLMTELRTAIDADASARGVDALLLTTAVSCSLGSHYSSITAVAGATNWLNVMCYDMHGTWESTAKPHSPLYSLTSGNDGANGADGISSYINAGVAPAKLLLGLPSYGNGYTLKSASNSDIGAPISGASPAGKYSRTAGSMDYYEIMNAVKAGGTAVEVSGKGTAYMVSGTTWVGFDSLSVVRQKCAYALSRGLGGIMVWSVAQDDVTAGFPVLSTIADALGRSEVTTTSTTTRTTTTTRATTTTTTPRPTTTTTTTARTSSLRRTETLGTVTVPQNRISEVPTSSPVLRTTATTTTTTEPSTMTTTTTDTTTTTADVTDTQQTLGPMRETQAGPGSTTTASARNTTATTTATNNVSTTTTEVPATTTATNNVSTTTTEAPATTTSAANVSPTTTEGRSTPGCKKPVCNCTGTKRPAYYLNAKSGCAECICLTPPGPTRSTTVRPANPTTVPSSSTSTRSTSTSVRATTTSTTARSTVPTTIKRTSTTTTAKKTTKSTTTVSTTTKTNTTSTVAGSTTSKPGASTTAKIVA